jgi:structure-specific endonuclease subunit SLX1
MNPEIIVISDEECDNDPPVCEKGEWVVYLIGSVSPYSYMKKTYVGMSNNATRRLRQHNGEIVGGARYTRQCRPWAHILVVHGFQNKVQAMQFEWAFKRCTKSVKGRSAVDRRIKALNKLLNKDRWTSNSPLAKEVPLTVRYHIDTSNM